MARKGKGPLPDDKPGAPAWVMTFADLMSLLMCFFVLLLSFSEMDAAKYKQVAGSMKFAFGVQREVKTLESPKGVSIIAKEFTPGKPRPTIEKVLRQQTTDENRQYLELLEAGELDKLIHQGVLGGPKTGAADSDGKGKGTGGRDGEQMTTTAGAAGGASGDGTEGTDGSVEGSAGEGALAAENGESRGMSARQAARVQAAMLSIALEEEIDEGLLEVETQDEGVLVRVREQGSFPSGTPDLDGTFLPVLDKIARALISHESRLVVSGHTDNVPISTGRFPSNWMLSAARATSVVQAFARRGVIAEERMEVRAHADTAPVASNGDAKGRARNRRVEIFIGTPPTEPKSGASAAKSPPEDAT